MDDRNLHTEPISSAPSGGTLPMMMPAKHSPLARPPGGGFAFERTDSLSRRPKGGAPPALRLLIPHSNRIPHAPTTPSSLTTTATVAAVSPTTPNTALMSPLSPNNDFGHGFGYGYTGDPDDETGPLPLSPTYQPAHNLDPDRSMDQLKTVAWKPRRIMNRSPPQRPRGATGLKKVPTLTRIMPPPPLAMLQVSANMDLLAAAGGGDVSPSVAPSSPRMSYAMNADEDERSFQVHELADEVDKTVLDSDRYGEDEEEGDDTELEDDAQNDDDLIPTPQRLLPRRQFAQSPPPIPPMISVSLEGADPSASPYDALYTPPPPRDTNSPLSPLSPSSTRSSPIAFDSSSTNPTLLSGCVLAIQGFTSHHMPALRELARTHGALVAPQGTSPVSPGYVGVHRRYLMLPVACPALAQLREKYGEAERRGEVEVVTDVWMYHSLKSNSLLSPTASFLYRPHLLDPLPDLSGSQIALCGFPDHDRRALVQILQSLGARIHGTFRVTSDVAISAHPDDELERRASAWGARVAGVAWVEAMVQKGMYVMPREFPIRNPRPLDGVIIYVTDSVEQAEDMHMLAQSLGARFLTSFSPRCTHVVHMSKHPPLAGTEVKEASEVEIAKGLDRFVVSPWWLTMCSRDNKRMDEVKYPSWYFPDAATLSRSA